MELVSIEESPFLNLTSMIAFKSLVRTIASSMWAKFWAQWQMFKYLGRYRKGILAVQVFLSDFKLIFKAESCVSKTFALDCPSRVAGFSTVFTWDSGYGSDRIWMVVELELFRFA